VRQLLIVETRLAKVKYLPHTYARKSRLSDTEPASQWMAENPNVRFVGILTGRGRERKVVHDTEPSSPFAESVISVYQLYQ